MKNLFLFLPLLFLLSCKQQNPQTETAQSATKEAGWTKPMMIAVDAPTTYFDDVDDVDFSDYSKIVREVFEQVYAGKLQAYDFMSGKPLSIDEVKKSANRIDSLYVENPDPPYDLQLKVVKTEMPENITSLKVKETWHFNKETLQLEKKVLGIAPRVAVVSSETGEVKGYTPLFWVFFDKQAEEEFKKKANS